MLFSPLEAQTGESLRRLVLRLPAIEVSDGDTTSFDVERFAATLKRSHIEGVTLVASDHRSEQGDTSEGKPLEASKGEFLNRLAAACRGQGLIVDEAGAVGQEAGAMLDAFASRPALEAACYRRLSRGRSLVLEDSLDPSRMFDAEAYRLLGVVFGEIAFKERWCRGARPLVEVGIVALPNPTASGLGAARVLQAGGYAFDLLEASADFMPYRVIILPEDVIIDNALKTGLQSYLQQGGKLLASFGSEMEAERAGFGGDASGREAENGAGALRNGNTVVLTQAHFRSYAQSAGTRHRRAALDGLKLLLPDPLLRHDGPGTLEAIVTEQPIQNRWVLHLMHYLPMGFALDSPVRDDILPVHEVKISLKTPKPVVRIELRPQHHDELDFWEYQGRLEFVVPKVTGHRMVSIEFAKESAA